MVGRLDGKVAIVTGAAGYLGSSHCKHLAREGAQIVVTDIVEGDATVEAVKEAGGEAVFMNLDVTSWEDAQRVAAATMDRFGRIDILVNNAAIVADIQKPWTNFTPQEWERHVAVDLKGMFVCARAVFPAMQAQRYGKIINISSATIVVGFPNFLPYVSAKSGVIGFTRSLATEAGEFDVNVNAILVGLFPHEVPGMAPEVMEQVTQQVVGMQALKRVGDAADLSRAVVFLASDDSRWITGQAIAVDGGMVRTGG